MLIPQRTNILTQGAAGAHPPGLSGAAAPFSTPYLEVAGTEGMAVVGKWCQEWKDHLHVSSVPNPCWLKCINPIGPA